MTRGLQHPYEESQAEDGGCSLHPLLDDLNAALHPKKVRQS